MSSLKEIEMDIAGCTKCSFNESIDVRICGGTGSDHRVMFIAESPSTSGGAGIKGSNENFQTTSADLLFNEVRTKFGFKDCYLTDFVKCGKASCKPDGEKIENCLAFLKKEVEAVNPRVIVAVGISFSVQIAPDKRKSYDFADFIREKLQTDIPVTPTYHYSYVWRWKKKRGWDHKGAKLDQIKPDWKEKYEEQHRKIQELLQQTV
jgi:uracil-DNA glycosylase family 4